MSFVARFPQDDYLGAILSKIAFLHLRKVNIHLISILGLPLLKPQNDMFTLSEFLELVWFVVVVVVTEEYEVVSQMSDID